MFAKIKIVLVLLIIILDITKSYRPYSLKNKITSSNIIDFNINNKDLIHLPYRYTSNNKRKLKSINSVIETSTIATDGFTYAFVGGTVGVMFTMFALEWKKTKDKTLEGCPYCMGNGEILCAACNGAAFGLKTPCTCCNGRGLILCINCKGDGRLTPIILQSRNVRDPEFGASDNLSPDAP